MDIVHIIWLQDIVEKIEKKHGVRQDEVRELLEGHPQFRFAEKGHRPGEDVYAALGRTKGGRYLVTFFVYKKGGRALILTARDMTGAERRRHESR